MNGIFSQIIQIGMLTSRRENELAIMKIRFAGVLLAALAAQAATDYKIVAKYPVPGTGGWDYVTLDAAARRLYVSHAKQVEVLDVDSGKLVGTVEDTPGVHGAAIASEFKHGFTSNGNENKVSMFDLATLKTIKKIDVGEEPDGIYYDAATKRVFTNNHGTHDVSVIDADKGVVVGTIKVGGDGEQAVKAKDGLYYLNLEDKAEVVSFDPKSMEVKKHMPIGVAKTPTGLAYSAKTNHLFIACREKPMMVVMDAATGKVITSFPIGAGADWAEFDGEAAMALVSSGGDGTIGAFAEKSATSYENVGPIPTQASAKTMAFDAKTKKIYLPAAEMVVTPAADGKKARRTMKPGSFVVLVLGK